MKKGDKTHNVIKMVEDSTALHFPVYTVDGCPFNFCVSVFHIVVHVIVVENSANNRTEQLPSNYVSYINNNLMLTACI